MRMLSLGIATLFIIQSASAAGIPIPVSVDFTSWALPFGLSTSGTGLVLWRTGHAGDTPSFISESGASYPLSFQYLSSGGTISLPSSTNPKDHSANDQSDLWSDDAIAVAYTKGNDTRSAIIIYTSNSNGQAGLQTADASSTLPLIWKAVNLADLQNAAGANVNGSIVISTSSALYMPTEIQSTGPSSLSNNGACTTEGPYLASTRTNNGFCDYSTHYMMDSNNSGWYGNLTGTPRTNAFNYAALIGALGVNTTEQGAGTGIGSSWNPAYFVIGTNVGSALSASYSTIINVELLSQ